MRVLQVLPSLDSGGVERGTVDFAQALVKASHESLVMSSGGRLVSELEQAGSRHIEFPVHKKSLSSLFKVRALRKLLLDLKVDLIHVRSRVPAWMVWLALKPLKGQQRPALVSTFHGLYSISPYSAIMGCGDRVIAISNAVRDYIVSNYPKIDANKISVIHRGVNTQDFNRQVEASEDWRNRFFSEYPQAKNKPLILMPGRLSRWKGQPEFIELMAALKNKGLYYHGLIVGGPTPGKEAYETELHTQVEEAGLSDSVTFLGHRSDMQNLYAVSSLVCNLSQHPEPFGRTVIEALAIGTPVVAFNEGGPAESLKDCLPQGLVDKGNLEALVSAVEQLVTACPAFELPKEFTLEHQANATLGVYAEALTAKGS